MAYKKLVNLPALSEPFDGATKDYADYVKTKVNTALEKIKPIIVAHASYHGDLIKGDYQFTFGRSSQKSKDDMWNGFLTPQSGRIKCFVVEDFGLKCVANSLREKIRYETPIPLFTLLLIKNNESDEVVDLGTLNILFTGGEINTLGRLYSFTSNLAGGLEEYKINMKDILNLKTEINTITE